MRTMKAFVSGQLNEKVRIRAAYDQLAKAGIEVTHDWTTTDNIGDYSANAREAGYRAKLDVQGVIEADVYILLTDNQICGKGMYVELGAALALASISGSPAVCIVGPRNHESIFYYHPLARHFADLRSCLKFLQHVMADQLPARGQLVDTSRVASSKFTSRRRKSRPGSLQPRIKGVNGTLDLFQ